MTQISKRKPLFGTKVGPSIPISLITLGEPDFLLQAKPHVAALPRNNVISQKGEDIFEHRQTFFLDNNFFSDFFHPQNHVQTNWGWLNCTVRNQNILLSTVLITSPTELTFKFFIVGISQKNHM